MSPKYVLVGNTEDELALSAVSYLEARGYHVPGPSEWETPREFCRRIGISQRGFRRWIRSKWRPIVDLDRGPTGRVNRLRATPELEAFLLKHARCGQVSRGSGQIAAKAAGVRVDEANRAGKMGHV